MKVNELKVVSKTVTTKVTTEIQQTLEFDSSCCEKGTMMSIDSLSCDRIVGIIGIDGNGIEFVCSYDVKLDDTGVRGASVFMAENFECIRVTVFKSMTETSTETI